MTEAATDPAAAEALKSLRELPLPAPISYAPQTAGWVVVAIVLLVLAAYLAWRRHRRWLANRYRREALGELATIEQALGDPAGRPAAAAALPALVKRTALAFAPRELVARLTDTEWLIFLDQTFTPGGFVSGPGRLLPRLAYAGGTLDDAQLHDLVALVRRWIAGHHPIDGHHAGV